MALFIEHHGTRSEFSDDAPLVFVDETGDKDCADPNALFFGLAGRVYAAVDKKIY